jgi:hypothetical protein
MNKEQLSRVLCLFSCLFYLMGNKKNKETLSRFKSILDFPDATVGNINTSSHPQLCITVCIPTLVSGNSSAHNFFSGNPYGISSNWKARLGT